MRRTGDALREAEGAPPPGRPALVILAARQTAPLVLADGTRRTNLPPGAPVRSRRAGPGYEKRCRNCAPTHPGRKTPRGPACDRPPPEDLLWRCLARRPGVPPGLPSGLVGDLLPAPRCLLGGL